MAPQLCSVGECNGEVRSRGLCSPHYYRLREHGHFNQTRPADWGSREKHPLYGVWTSLRRKRGNVLSAAWRADFWLFVRELGDRPSAQHFLVRVSESEPMGPGNAAWKMRLPIQINCQKTKEGRATYQREFRKLRPEYFRNAALKKAFGITSEDYGVMLEKQAGVCAICSRPETAIDKRSGAPFALAVDHDHKSGAIRGLLCSDCNRGVGLFRDDPDVLAKAIAYLRRVI